MERFDFKKLNKAESKEQHHVGVSCKFAVSEHLDAEVEINSALETIRENIEISAKKEYRFYFGLKKQMACFDEGCSKLLEERKQANLQYL
jgi:hypothetical protein